MPLITLASSPLAPDGGDARIFVRDTGAPDGDPLLFLHGGWGYAVYPFDRQIERFAARYRIIAPDRSGYGASNHDARYDTTFHARAAGETLALMDALGVERAVLWGHSDGAVIAAHIALAAPARVRAMILEAFHFWRRKPRSRDFFETMARHPERLGARVTATLAREHGDPYWKELLRDGGEAWLALASEATSPQHDLFDGRLRDVQVSTAFIHGEHDPRTEPGELAAAAAALPSAHVHIIADGGHAPHSERAAWAATNRAAAELLG